MKDKAQLWDYIVFSPKSIWQIVSITDNGAYREAKCRNGQYIYVDSYNFIPREVYESPLMKVLDEH
jgi:hypothetical protein